VPNAFAQQVAAGHLVYAQESGEDVIVLRAKLKGPARPAAAPKGKAP
jgi:hypothetical protein